MGMIIFQSDANVPCVVQLLVLGVSVQSSSRWSQIIFLILVFIQGSDDPYSVQIAQTTISPPCEIEPKRIEGLLNTTENAPDPDPGE